PSDAGPDSGGESRADHEPPGRYVIVVRCGSDVATSEAAGEVRAGETTDAGALPLRRGATLSGRVSDASGAARAFTRVRVMDESESHLLDAWTDPEGQYEVDGLWPGVWTATVGETGTPRFARGEALLNG